MPSPPVFPLTRVHQPHSLGAREGGVSQAGSPHSLPSLPLSRGERVRVRGDSISRVRNKFPCEPAFLNLITVPLPAVSPSPARRERGTAGRTAVRPYTSRPLCGRGAGGEGEKRERLARCEPEQCTLVSVFAVRFKHSPHPNPPRTRGGSHSSSPVYGGGYTNRKGRVYNCPPPAGSPRFARGTEPRARSVPPARRGNLKEGVIGHTRFCELWLRDWY